MKKAFKNLFFVLIVVVVLYAYNTNLRPGKSYVQRKYEAWLVATENKLLLPGEASNKLPDIKINVNSTLATHKGTWVLNTITGDEHTSQNDQVLRILQLAREADLFSMDNNRFSRKHMLSLTIQSGDLVFRSEIDPNALNSNIKAQNFMKLFFLYASKEEKSLARVNDSAKSQNDLNMEKENEKS